MPPTLRFVLCGSVDDGKSTLIGRILYDSRQVCMDQMARLEEDSSRYGTQEDATDLALLMDGLQDEREQGITIDVAYRAFETCGVFNRRNAAAPVTLVARTLPDPR